MIRSLILILTLLYTAAIQASAEDKIPTSAAELLRLIDAESGHIDRYATPIYLKADSITARINDISDPRERLLAELDLAMLMRKIDSDSTLLIFRRGLDAATALGDRDLIEKYMIFGAVQYHIMGLSMESVHMIDCLDTMDVTDENRNQYYRAGLTINGGMYDRYPRSEHRAEFLNRAVDYAHALIDFTEADPDHRPSPGLAKIFLASLSGNSAEYVAVLNEAMAGMTISDPQYSLASKLLGKYYADIDNHEEAARIYSLGTLSDIRNSNLHGSCQILLAEELYRLDDTGRAYHYLTDALERSLRVDSRPNQMEISTLLKPVADDIRRSENRRTMILGIMSVTLIIALITILLIMRSYRREMIELRHLKQRLSDANATKETYISQYLNLSTTFLERLEGFAKTCGRKITAGQIEDLLQYVKSGKVIEQQRKEFYDIFDDTFIHIYPTFVNDVNALMHPDKRIVVTGNTLTTELRILAFQRLGIEDATKVARFLGLSLNTIYTYRNKIRARAIDRDAFDLNVMNIGIIS